MTPLIPIQVAMIKMKTASNSPPGLLDQDLPNWPRTNHAQLVVIPQEGQGIPQATMAPQGGNPRARWVPTPDSLGVSARATPNSVKIPRQTPTSSQRSKGVKASR